MRESRVRFHWEDFHREKKNYHTQFRTGVSLHSHTLHSRESLDFIGRATANTPWLSGAIKKQSDKYRALKGRDLDLGRAWWTPPLSPLHAWKLEKAQIQDSLDLSALVSLTDHDNIHAGMNLKMLDETRACPISVEWTVPWGKTFFHLGLHNLPAGDAAPLMAELAVITARPRTESISGMLNHLHAIDSVLIVMNHPLWDENHIGAVAHRDCVDSFLTQFVGFMRAFELNGLRPWKENRAVMELAKESLAAGDLGRRSPWARAKRLHQPHQRGFIRRVRGRSAP